MSDLPQRWLSLAGICTTLNLTPSQVKTLHRQKLLVRIGKWSNQFQDNYRYLDPTPEYAERLRLAAVMLTRNSEVPIDLSMTTLLTVREVAEIMGWSLRYAQNYMKENKVPAFKSKNRAALYSIFTIRTLLWRRQNRRQAGHIAPLLLPEIISFFMKFKAAEETIVPTDADFVQDAELQKKLRWMLKQPNRDVLLADFVSKMELARQVVAALETTSPGESDTRQ